MYTFDDLYLSNYFLYHKQRVPLANQGLVIVTGEYGYKNRSNASGKSLLFSGLSSLVYADFPVDKAVYTKDFKLHLKASIPYENKIYDTKIAYNMYRDSRYTIKQNGEDKTPMRKKDVKALLLAMFPEEALFYATTFVTQFSGIYNSIIEGTPAARAKTIESFIDLSKVDKIKDILKERSRITTKTKNRIELYTETEKEAKDILKKYSSITQEKIDKADILRSGTNEEIRVQDKLVANLENKKKGYLKYKELQDRLKTDKSKRLLLEAITQLEQELSIIKKLEKVHKTIQKYVEAGKPELYTDIKHIPNFGKIPLLDREIPAQEDIDTILAYYRKLEYEIEKKQAEIENMQELLDNQNTVCPKCMSAISATVLSKDISKSNRILVTLTKKSKIKQQTIKLIYGIMEMSRAFVLADVSVNFVNRYIDRLKADPKEIGRKLSFYRQQLTIKKALDVLSEIEYTPQNEEALRTSLNKLKKLVVKKDKTDNLYISLSTHLTLRLEKEREYKEIKEKRKKLEKSIANDIIHLPLVSKAISSRQLKADSLFNFYEFLVEDWNLYSKMLFNNTITFGVGKEQGFPTFVYKSKGSELRKDIRRMSGGERKRLIMTMLPSILKVSPCKSNILILDEIDANLDDKGLYSILDMLPIFLNESFGKTSIFFITAKQRLAHSDYSNWRIVRKGNKSRLIYQ